MSEDDALALIWGSHYFKMGQLCILVSVLELIEREGIQ